MKPQPVEELRKQAEIAEEPCKPEDLGFLHLTLAVMPLHPQITSPIFETCVGIHDCLSYSVCQGLERWREIKQSSTSQKSMRLRNVHSPFQNILDNFHCSDEEIFIDVEMHSKERVKVRISE